MTSSLCSTAWEKILGTFKSVFYVHLCVPKHFRKKKKKSICLRASHADALTWLQKFVVYIFFLSIYSDFKF